MSDVNTAAWAAGPTQVSRLARVRMATSGVALAFVVSLACYIVIIFVLPPSQSASTT